MDASQRKLQSRLSFSVFARLKKFPSSVNTETNKAKLFKEQFKEWNVATFS